MPWRWLLLAAAVASITLGALKLAERVGLERGRAEVMAQWNAAELARAELAAEADKMNREREAQDRARIEQERQAHAEDLSRARAAAGGARTELDRLRGRISELDARGLPGVAAAAGGLRLGPPADAAPGGGLPAGSALAAGADEARTARQLLGECAAAHQELAGEADELAIQLSRLLAATAR